MPDSFWWALPGIIGALASAYNVITLRRVEKNTNSLTQQLVKSTGDAEYKRGGEDEKKRPIP
jgi:hypothetical protein